MQPLLRTIPLQVLAAAAVLIPIPNAIAAPAIPDLDSLIDDSGPLPGSVGELQAVPTRFFATDSGIVCKVWHGRLTHDVDCAGGIPGAPPEAGGVQLPGVFGKGSVPARFVAAGPDALVAGTAPAQKIPVGHKVVFWDFSPAQSMVCGVPPSAELVCVLKEPQERGGPVDGPVTTHGFVIASPQSWVF